MTKDQLENLLQLAGCDENSIRFGVNAFEMGMEHEREECAKICDENIDPEYKTGKVDHNEIAWAQLCAIQIRKRGQE